MDHRHSFNIVAGIDYQTRLVTQSMTATDMYYQPYNVHEAWGEWGERVLEQVECTELYT